MVIVISLWLFVYIYGFLFIVGTLVGMFKLFVATVDALPHIISLLIKSLPFIGKYIFHKTVEYITEIVTAIIIVPLIAYRNGITAIYRNIKYLFYR